MPRIVLLLSAALLLVLLGQAGQGQDRYSDRAVKIIVPTSPGATTDVPARSIGQYATQTYDYYIKDLKPFSRHLQIAPSVVDSTVNTLIQVGDIKQSEIQRSKVIDATYLPQ